MNVLDHFSIPYKGLGIGRHELHFQVDSQFFTVFEDAVVDNGNFDVRLELEKKSDHGIMTFFIEGTTNTSCDRCLAAIDLPIKGQYKLHLKFSETESEDDEIVFIHPDTSIINVAKYIYDVIGVSMPMTKIYDCEEDSEPPCNQGVLSKFIDEQSEDDSSPSDESKPSPWDGLKGLSFE